MSGIVKLKAYAKTHNIPIIMDDGLEFLCTLIKQNNYKSVLEIGSAIGYSAINIALINNTITVTTIERDQKLFKLASANIQEFNLTNQIELVYGEALHFKTNKKYDVIFIDGAKSQYQKFFELFKNNLNINGIIVCDNLAFHGHVNNYEQITSRNLRQLVRKIISFKQYLVNNQAYYTKFYEIGDGMSISWKVK